MKVKPSRKSDYKILAILLLPWLLSCSTAQVEKSKMIASKTIDITVASLPLIARVATAYGAPYAEIVTAFAMATHPDEFSDDESEDESEFADYADNDLDEDGMVDEEFDLDTDGIPDELQSDDNDENAEWDDAVDETGKGGSFTLTANIDIVQEIEHNGQITSRILDDGDVLRSSDNYKFQVGCNLDCYAYIAQLDATGKMDPILPSAYVDSINPLSADSIYSLPGNDNWFYLDNNTGLEQVYFIFSKTPRDDIEEIFQQLTSENQNLKQVEKVSIQEKMTLTRGIAGVRRGNTQTVQQSNGSTGQYISTVINGSGADLVLTRWFKHQ